VDANAFAVDFGEPIGTLGPLEQEGGKLPATLQHNLDI
jgi:hypothetical protein